MKTILTLVLLMAFQIIGIAQTKSILIVDAETKEAIRSVHIYHPKKHLGFNADQYGMVHFSSSVFDKNDSLIVSHVAYEKQLFQFDELLKRDTIFLTPLFFTTPDIVVKGEKSSLNLDEIVEEAVKNYNFNKPKQSTISKVTISERAWFKNEPIMFTESEGYGIFNELKAKVALYSNFTCIPILSIGIMDEPEYVESFKDLGAYTPYQPMSNIAPNVFRRVEERGILSIRSLNESFYKLDTVFVSNNKSFIRINYTTRKWFSVFDSGSITIDFDTKQIQEVTFSSKYYNLFLRKALIGKIALIYYSDIPYLNSIEVESPYREYKHKVVLKITRQLDSQFELEDNEYWECNSYSMRPNLVSDSTSWSFIDRIEPEFLEFSLQKRGDLAAYLKQNPEIYKSNDSIVPTNEEMKKLALKLEAVLN